MKTPFARRADAFAAALDAAAAGSPAASAAGTAPLVELAQRLSSLPQRPLTGLDGAFRTQLLAQSAAALSAPAGPSATAAPATAPAATSAATGVTGVAGQIVAGAMALAVAVTGVGAATARSHPGDPLHGLRVLMGGDRAAVLPTAGAGELSATATDRLADLERLLANNVLDPAAAARVEALVADLSSALNAMLDRLASGEVSAELVDRVTLIWNELADLVPALPTAAQRAALETLSIVNNRLGALIDGASPVSGPSSRDTSPGPSTSPTPASASPTPTATAASSPSPQPSPTWLPLPLTSGVPAPSPSTSTTFGGPLPAYQPDRYPAPVLPTP